MCAVSRAMVLAWARSQSRNVPLASLRLVARPALQPRPNWLYMWSMSYSYENRSETGIPNRSADPIQSIFSRYLAGAFDERVPT